MTYVSWVMEPSQQQQQQQPATAIGVKSGKTDSMSGRSSNASLYQLVHSRSSSSLLSNNTKKRKSRDELSRCNSSSGDWKATTTTDNATLSVTNRGTDMKMAAKRSRPSSISSLNNARISSGCSVLSGMRNEENRSNNNRSNIDCHPQRVISAIIRTQHHCHDTSLPPLLQQEEDSNKKSTTATLASADGASPVVSAHPSTITSIVPSLRHDNDTNPKLRSRHEDAPQEGQLPPPSSCSTSCVVMSTKSSSSSSLPAVASSGTRMIPYSYCLRDPFDSPSRRRNNPRLQFCIRGTPRTVEHDPSWMEEFRKVTRNLFLFHAGHVTKFQPSQKLKVQLRFGIAAVTEEGVEVVMAAESASTSPDKINTGTSSIEKKEQKEQQPTKQQTTNQGTDTAADNKNVTLDEHAQFVLRAYYGFLYSSINQIVSLQVQTSVTNFDDQFIGVSMEMVD